MAVAMAPTSEATVAAATLRPVLVAVGAQAVLVGPGATLRRAAEAGVAMAVMAVRAGTTGGSVWVVMAAVPVSAASVVTGAAVAVVAAVTAAVVVGEVVRRAMAAAAAAGAAAL